MEYIPFADSVLGNVNLGSWVVLALALRWDTSACPGVPWTGTLTCYLHLFLNRQYVA